MPPFPWVFPYGEDPVTRTSKLADRTVLRPLLNVTMVGPDGEEVTVLALVDSGAEHTLSSIGFARSIGVDPDPNRVLVLGVGGEYRETRFGDVTLCLSPYGGAPGQGVEWQTEVGFFTKWEPPYGLVLGQVGFFNHFTVTMSRFSQALAVEALEQFDQRFLS
jgi:hypothetical protein